MAGQGQIGEDVEDNHNQEDNNDGGGSEDAEDYTVKDRNVQVDISRREGYVIAQGVFSSRPELEGLVRGSVQTSQRRYNGNWNSMLYIIRERGTNLYIFLYQIMFSVF